jgi:hypothetical protein
VEPRQDWYSRQEVARRVGIAESTVPDWAKRHDIGTSTESRRKIYSRTAVDDARQKQLGLFDDVLDLQPDGSVLAKTLEPESSAERVSELEGKVRDLQSVLRGVVSARDSFRTGVQAQLTAEMQLLDTLLAAAAPLDMEG